MHCSSTAWRVRHAAFMDVQLATLGNKTTSQCLGDQTTRLQGTVSIDIQQHHTTQTPLPNTPPQRISHMQMLCTTQHDCMVHRDPIKLCCRLCWLLCSHNPTLPASPTKEATRRNSSTTVGSRRLHCTPQYALSPTLLNLNTLQAESRVGKWWPVAEWVQLHRTVQRFVHKSKERSSKESEPNNPAPASSGSKKARTTTSNRNPTQHTCIHPIPLPLAAIMSSCSQALRACLPLLQAPPTQCAASTSQVLHPFSTTQHKQTTPPHPSP